MTLSSSEPEAWSGEDLVVPDAFAPVVGFRQFGVPWPLNCKNGYLVQRGHRWTPGAPTVAVCRRPGASATPCGKAAPNQTCGCGLHAWLEIEEALRYERTDTVLGGWVLASVIGWGRVLFDEDFWRSEVAQVVAFADPRDTRFDKQEPVQARTAAWLEKVAANYGVPILPLEDLREHALIYGEEYQEHG